MSGRRPPEVEAALRRAIAAQRQGRLEDAALLCESALCLVPGDVDALYNLGLIRQRLGRPDQAVLLLGRAARLTSGLYAIHNALGFVLMVLGRPDEAAEQYRRALACKQEDAGALHGLGKAVMALGRRDEARGLFERAAAAAPGAPLLYRSLGETKSFTAGDPHFAAMLALEARMEGLSPDDQAHLHAALGKAYQDLGDSGRAFAHILAGNRIKRGRIAYDEAAAMRLLARIPEIFTPSLMAAHAGAGDPSPLPIFIIGMPRSGSTLVEQILASHPSVAGGGEAVHFADAMRSMNPSGRFIDLIPDLTAGQLTQLGADYVARLQAEHPAAERVTDKLPENFLCAGLIHLALPNASFIHARRNALDTCLSRFSKIFENGQPYGYDLAELGRYHRAFESVMEHWRRLLPQKALLDVDYEEVVRDLPGQARRIVAHCGLAWNDACLTYHETERAVMTPSALQVRRPIYDSAIGRWKAYRTELQPLIEALGLEAERLV